MPPTSPFRLSAGFLISQLGVTATRSWAALLADSGLSSHQSAALMTLCERGPLTLTALSASLLVDPRNMGPVLEPLERLKFIGRANDPTDRRRRLIVLTEPGEIIARELHAGVETLEKKLLEPLDEDARDVLRGLLLILSRQATSE